MCQLPTNNTKNEVIVGLETPDDAGVYQISEDYALIQTLDFFTPIVDDPYMYGQIAAANSLSDVYAMGGQPITCMNIVGFPINKLEPKMLSEILKGSADKVNEAGATLIGGHSIDNTEPIIGLSVTGKANPKKIWTNVGAKPSDILILTKPIGIGIQTKAIKDGILDSKRLNRVTEVMAQLNKYAADVMIDYPISAATDVTGFGLLGHALEMISKSEIGLSIHSKNVPILEGTKDIVINNKFPGGSKNNLDWVSKNTSFSAELDFHDKLILADAVTSGGLLFAVNSNHAESLLRNLHDNNVLDAKIIGEFTNEHPGKITVD